MPAFWVLFTTLYFVVCIFITIAGFLIITRTRGSEDPGKVWKHEDELA